MNWLLTENTFALSLHRDGWCQRDWFVLFGTGLAAIFQMQLPSAFMTWLALNARCRGLRQALTFRRLT